MHVLIVDDEPLAREELSYIINQNKHISSIDEAESIDEAMEKMIDHKPDILFLDIHLAGETGFELADKLKKLKNPPYLIFATAYDQYALQAFQADAKDYILKPFDDDKIKLVLEKAFKYISPTQNKQTNSANSIPIQTNDRIYLIDPCDIFAISIEDHTLNIILEDKSYTTSGSLSKIEELLPTDIFIKTHRSYILNSKKIKEIQSWFNNTLQVILTNDQAIPVSRSYVKNFKEKIGLN
jgi:Response regulator of the LytR/AlgR family